MSRFFVPSDDLRGAKATVSGPELDHLRRVLRLRPGDRVILFDDRGLEHEGIIDSLSRRQAIVDIVRSHRPERESTLEVTLAQALGKGDKMDLVVEKVTELGVACIVPFFSAHTVPNPPEHKLAARRERWSKIALGAAKQCGRTRVPEILAARDFGSVVAEPWPCELKLLLWEREAQGSLLGLREEKPELRSVLVMVGPEGGFSEAEADRSRQNGFRAIRLGRRVLRTETAALAALAAVQCLWGDLG